MIHRVLPKLAFGDESLCTGDPSGAVAVVHACKDPCHRGAIGYAGRGLPNTHPNYLVLETQYHLFLNLIDPPQPLFMRPSFDAFFGFVDKNIALREVLIHCNLGESRAPSLALLYASKRAGRFPGESYEAAAQAFATEFPYKPGNGIRQWLAKNWADLG
jgi:hypothetical protein